MDGVQLPQGYRGILLFTTKERDQNINKTCVFIFHHSIQHDEASSYTFYNINFL